MASCLTTRRLLPALGLLGVFLMRGEVLRGSLSAAEDRPRPAPPQEHSHKEAFEKGPLFPIIKDCKFGLIDITGRVVVTPRYEAVGTYTPHGCTQALTFRHGLEPVAISTDNYGFINRRGEWVVKPRFAFVEPFRDGWARVGIGQFHGLAVFRGKVGYVDTQGKPVIPVTYDALGNPKEDKIPVSIGGQWGYLDTQGKMIIERRFDWAGSFSDGYARIREGTEYGFIDNSGRVVIRPQFAIVGSFHEGLAVASGKAPHSRHRVHHGYYRDGRLGNRGPKDGVGYVDPTGTFAIAPTYKVACDFKGGRAWVQLKDDRWCAIDRSGKPLTKPYHYLYSPVPGLSPVRIGEKVGYVDTNGTMVIEPNVVFGSRFAEGLAFVKAKEGGKYGCIDQKGALIFPPRFDNYTHFHDGVARVNVGCRKPGEDKLTAPGKWGLIDKKGRYIVKPTLEWARSFNGGLAYVVFRSTQNDQNLDHGSVEYGYVNLKGQVVYRTTKRYRVVKPKRAEEHDDDF